jgi:hypothetical protein
VGARRRDAQLRRVGKAGPLLGVSLDWLFYGIRSEPMSRSGIMGKLFQKPGAKVYDSEFGVPVDDEA